MDICSVSNAGSPGAFTHYDKDFSRVEYVSEGYCVSNHANIENDEMIARAFQEELSRLTLEENHGSPEEDHQKESVLAQDWLAPSKRHELDSIHEQDLENVNRTCNLSLNIEERSGDDDNQSCSPEMADESTLDGEVGKRINQMVPIRHVPKVNGEVPSADEATSDHQRLMDRLQLYDLVELKVSGDGNCQFRSLSDQIYRSSEHHKLVREQVVHQLKFYPELYAAYVPMAYDEYLKKISTSGEWGDHVTLQAAADAFGVKIFVLTSYKDTCYIEILPCAQKSKRIIFLSFWAEVHYNSIYPEGDLPTMEQRKKKKWWMLGS
ncbi:OTU domain-containing protein DDB_G0284757 isoform X2 [Cynara cardunculus var. scolymus]|nr:OTU domain-containing protein DDB_G0284757 isoform X2 [Cynara cardunculus var. scolymus]